MSRFPFIALLILLQVALHSTPARSDAFNPKPEQDDFVLPMPDNAEMVFRPVFIGQGGKPFALKEFKVGNLAGGGFKEYPTKVAVGGSFIAPSPQGQKDWLYYIGKYEVTQAQYDAVMHPGSPNTNRKPITNISWFEVQEFINTYNMWLFEHARDQLPKNDDAFGFLRLPTEIEWEFAARGGSVVEQDQFLKKRPYPAQLAKYEWFAGPKSSHGKVKNIGILKPNALKIYDILGNVSEMTSSLYRIEYYQGRMGGFVSRGGHCLTDKKQLRSSLRGEVPFYKEIKGRIRPSKQKTLGLRLLISSQIFTKSQNTRAMATAWEDYRSSRPTPRLPRQTTLPKATQTNIQLEDVRKSLEHLEKALTSNPQISRDLLEQFSIVKAGLQDVESTVNRAEKDSAEAWVRIMIETAYFIASRDMKRLPMKRKALQTAKDMGRSRFVDDIRKQVETLEQNIKEGMISYGFCFDQLEEMKGAAVNDAFEKYRKYLTRKSAYKQLKIIPVVMGHYKNYMADKQKDVVQWKVDFKNI